MPTSTYLPLAILCSPRVPVPMNVQDVHTKPLRDFLAKFLPSLKFSRSEHYYVAPNPYLSIFKIPTFEICTVKLSEDLQGAITDKVRAPGTVERIS